MKKKRSFAAAMKFAFRKTYVIGISWIPIAIAFGLIVQNAGGSFIWTGLSGIICPFGTLQMLAFSFAASNVVWLTMLVTSFAVTCRHVFYGLPFLEKFNTLGREKYYIIYMLCDEAFSTFVDMDIPEDVDERQAYLAVAVTLHLYWLVFTMLATLLGSVIPFDLTGVDFALTALFAAITVNMLRESGSRLTFTCALVCGFTGLFIFGADSFLAPSLLLVTLVLLLLRPVLEKQGKEAERDGV